MANDDLDLRGYPEFIRAIKEISKRFPDAFDEAARNVASEWVSLARSAANKPQEALAAASLTSAAGSGGATITATSPIFPGAEFGGQGRPTTMQFPPYQGKRGYWFYPTARENSDRLNDTWQKALEAAMKPWNHKEL